MRNARKKLKWCRWKPKKGVQSKGRKRKTIKKTADRVDVENRGMNNRYLVKPSATPELGEKEPRKSPG